MKPGDHPDNAEPDHSLQKITVDHDTWLDLMKAFGAVTVTDRHGTHDLTKRGD